MMNISKDNSNVDNNNKKSFKGADTKVEHSSSFNGTAHVTRSSLTELKSVPSQENNPEMVSLCGSKSKDSGNLSYLMNNTPMSMEEKQFYSLVALPISPMAQLKNQGVFDFDRGDNQSYDSTRSPKDNLANISSKFSELSVESNSNSSMPLYHKILPTLFLDTSRPPPNIGSYTAPEENAFRAVVENAGFISLQLKHGVTLDISSNKAIRMNNYYQESKIALSSCATQMALTHPKGRLLQYGSRIEIQAEDQVKSLRNDSPFQ